MLILIMYHYTLQLVIYFFFLPQSHFTLLNLLIKKQYTFSPIMSPPYNKPTHSKRIV